MLIRFISYLCLIILSLLIPFLLNRRDKNIPLLKKLIPVGVSFGLITLIIIVVSVFSGGLIFTSLLKLIIFLLVYSIMLSGLCVFMISLGVSGNVSQVIVTMLAFLMIGTVFYTNPFISSSISTGFRKVLVQWSIDANPLMITGSQVFHDDMLRLPVIYQATSIHYYPYRYPDLGMVILVYLAISILCFSVPLLKVKKNETGASD